MKMGKAHPSNIRWEPFQQFTGSNLLEQALKNHRVIVFWRHS